MRRLFTDAEISTIRELSAAGVIDRVVGVWLGRPTVSVANVRRRLGIAAAGRRKYTRPELGLIDALVQSGKSSTHIGPLVGRTPAAVSLARLKHGIEPPKVGPVSVGAFARMADAESRITDRKRMRQEARLQAAEINVNCMKEFTMPRYATGTIEGYSGALYGVADHPDDDTAVADFKAMMAESHPDVLLTPAGDFDRDGCDFVVRVADDFPLGSDGIEEGEVTDWVRTYKLVDRERLSA